MTVQKTLIYLLKPGRRIQARTTRQRPGWLPSLRQARRDPIPAWQDAWLRTQILEYLNVARFVRAPRGLIQLAAPSGNLMFGAVAASPQQPTVTRARSRHARIGDTVPKWPFFRTDVSELGHASQPLVY